MDPFEIIKRILFQPRSSRTSSPLPVGAPARWEKALSDFGYPYQIVPGDKAEAAFKAEQQLGAEQGFSPILIVPGLWISQSLAAQKRAKQALASISERYNAAFGRAFLADRLANFHRALEHDPEVDSRLFDVLQPVAAQAQPTGIMLLRQYNPSAHAMETVEAAALMRIPTPHAYWIPVYLGWGSWNAVPSPLEIAAVARHWGETYGVTLIAMTSDRLEFSVARKPATHQEAVALLKEHYCFAPDTYELDRSFLEQAAAELLVLDSWTFWWD